MPAETSRGFPYPLETEPVEAGARNVAALAQAVNDLIQGGRVEATLSNTRATFVDVTFPVPFPSAPASVVAVCEHSSYNCAVRLINSDGCRIDVNNIDAAAASLTVGVRWVAVP